MCSMQNVAPVHNHDTRHCGQLRPPHRISKYRQSILYLGPIYWNDIPPSIRNSPSAAIFKNQIKTIKFAETKPRFVHFWLFSTSHRILKKFGKLLGVGQIPFESKCACEFS